MAELLKWLEHLDPALLAVLSGFFALPFFALIAYAVVRQGRELRLGSLVISAQPRTSPERTDGGTVCKSVFVRYVKVFSLNQERSAGSAYDKYIPRLDKTVRVLNESIWFNLAMFPEPQKEFKSSFRSGGVADGTPLHPWGKVIEFSDKYDKMMPSYVEQLITVRSNTYSTAFHSYNGFGPGKEDVGLQMDYDAEEIRLIADFSSVPKFRDMLNSQPRAVLKRGELEEAGAVESSAPGVFYAVRRDIRKGDILRIKFDLNWKAGNDRNHEAPEREGSDAASERTSRR